VRRRQDINQTALFSRETLNILAMKAEVPVTTNYGLARLDDSRQLAEQLGGSIAIDAEIIYFNHEWLATNVIEGRYYALDLIAHCLDANSIIILPTGLGKTYLKAMLIAVLRPAGKVLLLAPTKPLCSQHAEVLARLLPNKKVGLMTGDLAIKKRQLVFDEADIIVATAQTMASGKKRLADWGLADKVSLVLIDEVHHTKGKYATVNMAEYYKTWRSLITNEAIRLYGFTASVSETIEDTELIRQILGVDINHVLGRTVHSPDVKPYLFLKDIKAIQLDFDPPQLLISLRQIILERLLGYFQILADKHNLNIDNYIYYDRAGEPSGFKILEFMALEHRLLKGGNTPEAIQDKVDWGIIMRFYTALQMADKGLSELSHYITRQVDERESNDARRRSQLRFTEDDAIIKVISLLYQNRLWGQGRDLPRLVANLGLKQSSDTKSWTIVFDDTKLRATEGLIRQFRDKKIMIFVKYRDTLNKVRYFIQSRFPDLPSFILIGTDKSSGHQVVQTRSEQQEAIAEFGKSAVGILLATSIGEEGLDLPSVDTLIFYEPVGDIRRDVQRKGRTGRHAPGKVFVLVYRHGQEAGIYRSLLKKEAQVEKILNYYQQKNRPT